jgi:hypothetical protein
VCFDVGVGSLEELLAKWRHDGRYVSVCKVWCMLKVYLVQYIVAQLYSRESPLFILGRAGSWQHLGVWCHLTPTLCCYEQIEEC